MKGLRYRHTHLGFFRLSPAAAAAGHARAPAAAAAAADRIRIVGQPGEETIRMGHGGSSIFVLLHDIVGQRLQLLNQIRKVAAIIWNHGILPHRVHRLAIEDLQHGQGILVGKVR